MRLVLPVRNGDATRSSSAIPDRTFAAAFCGLDAEEVAVVEVRDQVRGAGVPGGGAALLMATQVATAKARTNPYRRIFITGLLAGMGFIVRSSSAVRTGPTADCRRDWDCWSPGRRDRRPAIPCSPGKPDHRLYSASSSTPACPSTYRRRSGCGCRIR